MRAMKAMRLTAMLAISDIDWEAPLEAASMIFLSWLKKNISLAVWLNKSVLFVTNDYIFLNVVYKRIIAYRVDNKLRYENILKHMY